MRSWIRQSTRMDIIITLELIARAFLIHTLSRVDDYAQHMVFRKHYEGRDRHTIAMHIEVFPKLNHRKYKSSLNGRQQIRRSLKRKKEIKSIDHQHFPQVPSQIAQRS